MQNKNMSNNKLNLNLKPSIVRINRMAFGLICAVVIMVGTVLFYSVTRTHEIKKLNVEEINEPATAENQKLWYQAIPDIQLRSNKQNISELSNDRAKLMPVSDIPKLDKHMSPELTKAMESPIKASMNELSSLNADMSSTHNTLPNTQDHQPSETVINSNNKGENFLTNLSQSKDSDVLHESLKKPASSFILQAGSLIPAIIAGGINSELPGQLTALVSQNVYDSIRGRYLIIPQGSKLILIYDSNVAYGQQRLLVAVKRVIFPNGYSMDLLGMPAVDASGYAGLTDVVDNHYSRIFGSSAIMGLITGAFQLSQSQQTNSSNNSSATEVMSGAFGQQMGQVTMNMMNKNLDIAPTLSIRPGYEFNVQVTKDLIFPGAY